MSKQKRHHTVPKFYLDNFAQGTESAYKQIATIDLLKDKNFQQSTVNASVRTGFYDIDHVSFEELIIDGNEDFKQWYLKVLGGKTFTSNSIENLLGLFENEVAPVISQIINYSSWPLSKEDRLTFSVFLALQHLRSNRSFLQISAAHTSFLENLPNVTKDEFIEKYDLNGKFSIEEFDKFWDKRKEFYGKFSLTPGSFLAGSLLGLIPLIVSEISQKTWRLLISNEEKLFTSDEPLSICSYDQRNISESMLIFPINRRLGLLMDSYEGPGRAKENIKEKIISGDFDKILPLTNQISEFFEFHTIFNAHQYIFCHPDQKIQLHEKIRELKNLEREIEKENFNNFDLC